MVLSLGTCFSLIGFSLLVIVKKENPIFDSFQMIEKLIIISYFNKLLNNIILISNRSDFNGLSREI